MLRLFLQVLDDPDKLTNNIPFPLVAGSLSIKYLSSSINHIIDEASKAISSKCQLSAAFSIH